MTLPVLKTPPGDNLYSTLAAPFLHGSATTVAFQPADSGAFGSPTPANPIRFTLVRPSQQSGQFWAISDRTKAATYTATGASGATLTGVAFESGTDQDFEAGSLVAVVITARDFADVHAHLKSGPINLLVAAASLGLAIVGDGIADDAPAIQAVLDAHPGEMICFPRTISQATWTAPGGEFVPSYHLGATLTMSPGQVLLGLSGFSAPVMLRWPAGVSGIVMAAGCRLENLVLMGNEPYGSRNYWEAVIPAGRFPGVTAAAGASDADGIRLAGASCKISNVICTFFGRDGINASAGDLGLGSGLGCECGVFDLIYSTGNRGNGIKVDGGDSNCTTWTGVNVNLNQFWGMHFDPFLCGVVISPQADGNGLDDSYNLITSDNATTAVASIVRSSNTVTLTWAAPQSFHPGDGVQVVTCTDSSFLGRWRVLTVAGDNSSLTYTQVAANASVTGGTTARANFLPTDYAIQSAARVGSTVTLTATAAMLVPIGDYPSGGGTLGFRVGQGVTLVNCPDASFNGTFVVLSVSTDKKTITYAQAGQAGATITSGTVRMAIPHDMWQCQAVVGPTSGSPEKIMGGAYRSVSGTASNVWVQPYAEGGQRIVLGVGNLVQSPAWSTDPEVNNAAGTGHALVIKSNGSGTGLPTVNYPLGLSIPYDGDQLANEIVGLTTGGYKVTNVRDAGLIVGGQHPIAWQLKQGAPGYYVHRGDPSAMIPVMRLGVEYAPGFTRTFVNSEGGYPVYVNAFEGGTGGLVVGNATGGNPLTTVNGGQITMFPIADSAAAVGSLFMGSDHGGKLCRKDSGGVVHVISETP